MIEGDDPREVSTLLREDRIIRKYLAGDLSIGEVAELMGVQIGEARDWLHGKGVATMRIMNPEMEAIAKSNAEELAKELGIEL